MLFISTLHVYIHSWFYEITVQSVGLIIVKGYHAYGIGTLWTQSTMKENNPIPTSVAVK